MADLSSAIDHLLRAKRISAASQSYHKDNPAEYDKVVAYLEGGARPTGVVTEMGMGLVEVEDVRRGVVPPPDPDPDPEPPPVGLAIDSLSDLTGAFVPGWVAPVSPTSTLSPVVTPQGDGFKIVCGANDHPTWDSSTKAILAQKRGVSAVGSTEDWYFSFMFPASGNGSGFPNVWHSGLLWEFHTQSDSGHHLAIDGRTSSGGPRLHWSRYKSPWNPGSDYEHIFDKAVVKLDHWYQGRMYIKWSSGTDGFLKTYLDGVIYNDFSGPTLKSGEQGYLQFGYYASAQLSNTVHFGGIVRAA